MGEERDTKPGICASLKRILDTLLATAQNPVELFSVELQEVKRRGQGQAWEVEVNNTKARCYGNAPLDVTGFIKKTHETGRQSALLLVHKGASFTSSPPVSRISTAVANGSARSDRHRNWTACCSGQRSGVNDSNPRFRRCYGAMNGRRPRSVLILAGWPAFLR